MINRVRQTITDHFLPDFEITTFNLYMNINTRLNDDWILALSATYFIKLILCWIFQIFRFWVKSRASLFTMIITLDPK